MRANEKNSGKVDVARQPRFASALGLNRLAARDKKSVPIASDQDQTVFAGIVKHLDIAGPNLPSRKNFTARR
jgi:hypothetical protein